MGLLRFALKSTVAGGCVYYTIREGLWSESEESVKLYGKIYNNVAPYVKKNIPADVVPGLPDLPSVTDVTTLVKASWNKGVMATFQFLAELPEYTAKGIEASGIKNAVLSAIDSINNPEKSNESTN